MVYVGLDVHKDSISAGVLWPGQDSPEFERFFHDEVSVRRFLDRLGEPSGCGFVMRRARRGSSSLVYSRRCGSLVW